MYKRQLLVWGGQVHWAEQSRRDQALFARTTEHVKAMQLRSRSSALERMQRELSGRSGDPNEPDMSPLSPAEQLQRARVATEAWRPYRSVGSWYMWRAVDLSRDGHPVMVR